MPSEVIGQREVTRPKVLICGGSALGRELAGALAQQGYHVILSLAGVTAEPLLPLSGVEIRHGGFGGGQGLGDFLRTEKITAVVDATHPFALQMSRQIDVAVRECQLPCFRLEPTAWVAGPEDAWQMVPDFESAAAILPKGAKVFLTTGHKGLGAFLARGDISGAIRLIEAPALNLPASWQLILSRPPYELAGEKALLGKFKISHLITKNAGTAQTAAKLRAAGALKIPVIMVARPIKPEMTTVHHLDQALDRLKLLNL